MQTIPFYPMLDNVIIYVVHYRRSYMNIRRTYRYRLLGNKETFQKAENWISLCRDIYNIALQQRIMIYKQDKGKISAYEQMKQLTALRNEFLEYKEVECHVLQGVIDNLNNAYLSFFRRIRNGEKPGHPRFRSKDRYDSFTLKKYCWKLNGKYLSINKIGRFKLRLSRPIEGNIKTITIRKEASGKWYACFSCGDIPNKVLPKSDLSVGLDVGIKKFIVDSDGLEIESPKYFNKAERQLRITNRRLCRRKKGSNRRIKAKVLVAKVYDKITNQRKDFLHKTANYYIKKFGCIYIEDLTPSDMVLNPDLSKSIKDASWGKFFQLLIYKAEDAGRSLTKVSKWEPTSKTCSSCGAVNKELKLSDRTWVCKECGVLHDRDYNAAKNILRAGQALQTLTCADTQSVVCKSTKKRRVSTPVSDSI